MIVFLKSTLRPWESVIWPSSNTCSKILNTSGCAFSISSNRITEYGFLRTFSLSCPPSSWPTYPGGEPIIFDTLCFSIYSDISTRIIDCSLPNTASASAFEISVFPTPVGPKNRKEPIGRLGSFNPTRPLRTAFATALTASSWPMTRLCKVASNFLKRAASPSAIFLTGIFVHPDTTSAISSSVTFNFLLRLSFFVFACILASSSSHASFSFFFCFAPSTSPSCRNSNISSSNRLMRCLNSTTSSGFPPARRRTFAAASSIRSIALSGRKRSLI